MFSTSGQRLITTLLLSAIVLGGVSTYVGVRAYSAGSAATQQKWDKERADLLAAALKVAQDNRTKENAHQIETLALENKIRETEAQYEKALADVRSDFGSWMRQSEDRSARYRGWAEGVSGEQERLADYAAKLDRSLSEGRELVAEFRVALGQCERDLKTLGQQISMDRKLIGE